MRLAAVMERWHGLSFHRGEPVSLARRHLQRPSAGRGQPQGGIHFCQEFRSPGQLGDAGYGFGWFIGHYRGLPEISRAGLMSGLRSYLVRLPDEKFTVANLVNTSPGRSNIDPMFLTRRLTTLF